MSERPLLRRAFRELAAREIRGARLSLLLDDARACAVKLRIIVGEIALLDAKELDGEVGKLFGLDATLRDIKAVVREILRKLPN